MTDRKRNFFSFNRPSSEVFQSQFNILRYKKDTRPWDYEHRILVHRILNNPSGTLQDNDNTIFSDNIGYSYIPEVLREIFNDFKPGAKISVRQAADILAAFGVYLINPTRSEPKKQSRKFFPNTDVLQKESETSLQELWVLHSNQQADQSV